eukprot:GHVH01006428.1.p1 GENE.GHVH01006428.1~~GHVH01006428.1.p1  ORF type:complete len:196 (+),score=14.81 GHVH01006428.1:138-725(+)
MILILITTVVANCSGGCAGGTTCQASEQVTTRGGYALFPALDKKDPDGLCLDMSTSSIVTCTENYNEYCKNGYYCERGGCIQLPSSSSRSACTDMGFCVQEDICAQVDEYGVAREAVNGLCYFPVPENANCSGMVACSGGTYCATIPTTKDPAKMCLPLPCQETSGGDILPPINSSTTTMLTAWWCSVAIALILF